MRQKSLLVEFHVILCIVSSLLCGLGLSTTASAQSSTPSAATGVRSTIQATGSGSVKLEPAILRISIPIRSISDSSWDAVEGLRNARRAIEERASEMGALEGSLQIFGFTCAPELPTSISIRGGNTKPNFAARCSFVADFELRKGQDVEETVGFSQSQLEQLTSLLPDVPAGRRSYSSSTMGSGLTSQQLERPLVLFVANVTEADKAAAFKQAFDAANGKLQATLDALGKEATSVSVSQSPNYSSIRGTNPLETVLMGDTTKEVVGVYADGVDYKVQLMVVGQFTQGD